MVLVGSGGFAEEMISWFSEQQIARVEGYLGATENQSLGVPYLGGFEDISCLKQQNFLLAVGAPAVREGVIAILEKYEKQFSSFIHPTATLSARAIIGRGLVMGPYSFVSVGARVGDFVFMNCYSSVGHHAQVGDRCVLNPYAAVTGACVLGSDCQLGLGSSMLPKVKLPNGTSVAPGASVYRSPRESGLLMGTPARLIKGV